MVKVSTDSIVIKTDQVSRLFDKNDLSGIRIRSSKNCCTPVEKEFTFCTAKSDCSYTTLYCTDSPGDICQDGFNDGSAPTCRDTNFVYIYKFYFEINGVKYNALSSTDSFDIRDAAAMTALKAKLLKWLGEQSCVNTGVDITVKKTGSNYCVKITFTELPYGYVPDYIQIRGKDICYAKSYFDCVSTDNVDPCLADDYARCLDFKLRIPLVEGSYRLYNITFQKPNCDKEIVQFEQTIGESSTEYYDFTYQIGKTVDFRDLYAQLNTWLTDNEYSGTFTISVLNGELILDFEGLTLGLLPVSWSYLDPEKYSVGNFECVSLTPLTPTCVWTADISDTGDCNAVSGKSYYAYVTKWVEGSVAPTPSGISSVDISDTAALLTVLKSAFPDGIVSVDTKIKIRDSKFIPDAVFVQRPDGTTEKIKFTCTNLSHVCDSDSEDTSDVGFTQDSIIIYPGLYGQTTIEDGIYPVEIVYVSRNGDLTTERYCVFQGAEIECKILCVIEGNPESDVHHLYEVLKFAGDCYDCDCSKACLIYKELVRKINKELNAQGKSDQCFTC